MSDRAALAGIIYVLRKGVAWRDVPTQVVGCSGVTSLAPAAGLDRGRRLAALCTARCSPRLRGGDLLDMDDCAIDGSHVRALKGGITSGPRPSTAAAPGQSTI